MKDISKRHAEFHKPATVDAVFALHFFLHVSVAMTGKRHFRWTCLYLEFRKYHQNPEPMNPEAFRVLSFLFGFRLVQIPARTYVVLKVVPA